jgi:hypothetical protein
MNTRLDAMGGSRLPSIMFVRKNWNRSGSISIQIISKEHGWYRVIETVGTSTDPDEIERLYLHAQS